MGCCGKRITKSNKIIITGETVTKENSYIEGSDGYIKVKYTGNLRIKVVGCKTGNRYLFENGVERSIDSNDANCILDLMKSVFENVESDNSKSKTVTKRRSSSSKKGNGQIYSEGSKRLSGNREDLEQESRIHEDNIPESE